MSDGSLLNVSQQHRLEQDRQRERKQRHKWQLGEAQPTAGHPGRRPNKPLGLAISRLSRREANYKTNKSTKMGRDNRKLPRCPDVGPCDSDDEEDTQGAFTGSAPDTAITYSYDRNGASKGSQILGQAITKAVEKYETKATEKLVKDEYEIVANEEDDSGTGPSTDEDDFELL